MITPLLSLTSSSLCITPSASRTDTNTSSGQSDILFLLGGCFQVQYCTSGTKWRHVTFTSRHVTYNVPAALLSPFYDRRKQLSRPQYGWVHQYNMKTARQVGVLQYFAPVFFQLFYCRWSQGTSLTTSSSWPSWCGWTWPTPGSPPWRCSNMSGQIRSGAPDDILESCFNPVWLFLTFPRNKRRRKNHSFQTIRVGDQII